ncbi:transcriptional regulator [Pedobacter lusitanus]|uniref:Transcriptional regulator n=1 Tax=Pedobacter lusitanus TaxID=1503925 RepID=A0A0D0GRR6_9SPHI|nr:response regulator [Pedobacter lusitanus]KIO78880.1 transcriptional regulator [Pedobacter lusitanus]
MKKIKVLIIDDERAARSEVRRLLDNYPEFVISGEAGNADEAKLLIEQQHPDILFLDIQMPEKSGFDLLESLSRVPQVIFITAYDQYAVKAFEYSALDYLMKPVREERFEKAICQIREKMVLQLSEDRIFVKDRGQYHFISWKTVYLIQSMDNYAFLHFEDKKVFYKCSLNQLEKNLDKKNFFRANRSQIINLQFIHKIDIMEKGRLTICLLSGDVIEVSERQSVKFKAINR